MTKYNIKNYEFGRETCYGFDETGLTYSSIGFYDKYHEFQIYEWEILDEETSIISFDEIERSKFTKKIYISHSYSGLERNKRDIEDEVKRLAKEYPNYVFISPVHTFGYLYDSYPYDTGIDLCIELLKICDEM